MFPLPALPPPRLRVLVVEDEALIAENLRQTLEDLGYEVPAVYHTFAEARAALAGPACPPADLVLLDLNLGSPDPALSGLALAWLLRQTGGPPFLFLTAYSDQATIRQATQTGPSGYLIKPVGGPALFAAIQAALEHATVRATGAMPGPLAPLPALPGPPPPAVLPAPPGQVLPPPAFFFVKQGHQTSKLPWTEVQRLEATKNYVQVYTAGRHQGHPLRGSLAYVLGSLMPADLRERFLRVSRVLCLNAAAITGYGKDHIYCGTESYENTRLSQDELAEALQKWQP